MGSDIGTPQEQLNAFQLSALIEQAFPDMRCLRCTHDQFYAMPSVRIASLPEAVVIACQRCGFAEQHVLSILIDAKKPIERANSE